jgi:NAD(P)-dependent dehydrogenase (short-subunit alcohol dehydrogenase family)
MTTLKAKTIYLTGASRGIGRAIALRLGREQACLALCGRDAKALEAVANEAKAIGAPKVFTSAFDFADETCILEFIAAARAAVGPADFLINNAGFNPRKAPLSEVTTAEMDSVLSVNFRAPFILAREVLRDMLPRRSGHIVNILSTVCHFANETMGAYTAAKSALDGLTGVLVKEVRPNGVRVTAIYPGGTDTTFRAKARPDYLKPESVAEAVHAVLTMPEDLVMHGVTFRPMVETNF